MSFSVLCLIFAISPFIMILFSGFISDKIFSGSPGAAIPGVLFGILYGIIIWSSLIAIIIYKLF